MVVYLFDLLIIKLVNMFSHSMTRRRRTAASLVLDNAKKAFYKETSQLPNHLGS